MSTPAKPLSDPKPENQIQKSNELLNVLAGNQKRSKGTTDGNGGDAMEIYRNAGKKAAALLDPFAVPTKAFLTSIQHDRGGQADDQSELDPTVVQQHLHFYNGILKFIPSLRRELNTMESAQLTKIMQAITKGLSDGRSTDLALVKHKGMKYIPENMYNKFNALDPPIPEVEDKSMCGIFHPQLARFLCPQRDLEEFDKNPEGCIKVFMIYLELLVTLQPRLSGMEALQAGNFPMKSSQWPAGFYSEDDVYDPKDKTFYKHLFLGPAAVTNNSTTRRAAKPSKNRAWGLNSVDHYIIAYVHIITYIMISHAQHWTPTIGDMDLQDLYWRIVEMLEDDSDPWPWLNWFRSHCNPTNGSGPSMRKKADNNGANSEDDMAQVRARRAGAITTATGTSVKAPGPAEDPSNISSKAPSRKEPKEKPKEAAPRASFAKSKQTEREAAQPKAPSRNGPICQEESENEAAPHILPAKPKRTKYEVSQKMASWTQGQLDKSYASHSLFNDDDDDHVNAHTIWSDSNIIGVDNPAGATNSFKNAPYPRSNSPLSQAPDSDVDDNTTANPQGASSHVMGTPIPTKHVKSTFSESIAKDNANDEPAPPPKKKAKKASMKPQTVPTKRNPARAKRPNGF